MKWDPNKRVYIDEAGKVVSPAQIRADVEAYIAAEQTDVEAGVTTMRAGIETIPQFFTMLREKLTAMHGAVSIVAYGGEDEMNAERWAQVGAKLHSELTFLDNFEKEVNKAFQTSEAIAHEVAREVVKSPDVPDALDDTLRQQVLTAIMEHSKTDVEAAVSEAVDSVLSEADVVPEIAEALVADVTKLIDPASVRMEQLIWGEVNSRTLNYLEATYGTYENGVKGREEDAGVALVRRVCEDDSHSCDDCPELATDEFVSFADVTDIGASQCGNNCRCYYEFSYDGVAAIWIEGDPGLGTGDTQPDL